MARAAAKLVSTEPMQAQRPFWPAFLLCAGGLLMNGPTLVFSHRDYAWSWIGLAVSAAGLVLTLRHFIVCARDKWAGGASVDPSGAADRFGNSHLSSERK